MFPSLKFSFHLPALWPEAIVVDWMCLPKKGMLKSSSRVPQNVTLFEIRVIADVIS